MENQEFIKSFRKDLIRKEEDGTYSIFGWEHAVQMNVWIAFYFPMRNEVRPCHGYFAPHPHGKNLQKNAQSLVLFSIMVKKCSDTMIW